MLVSACCCLRRLAAACDCLRLLGHGEVPLPFRRALTVFRRIHLLDPSENRGGLTFCVVAGRLWSRWHPGTRSPGSSHVLELPSLNLSGRDALMTPFFILILLYGRTNMLNNKLMGHEGRTFEPIGTTPNLSVILHARRPFID